MQSLKVPEKLVLWVVSRVRVIGHLLPWVL